MGKVAQVLIAGYWPDRVPRRIGVPQKPLGEQIVLACQKAGDQPALRSPAGVVTHADLLAQVRKTAAALAALVEPRATVALALRDPTQTLTLLLASQLAATRAALVDPAHPEAMAVLAPDLVITDAPELVPQGLRSLSLGDLDPAARGSGERRGRWRDLAILLPEGMGFAGHGHVSTTAMIKALTTYIPQLESTDHILTAPLHRWDGLVGALTALLSGRAVILSPEKTAFDPREACAFLPRAEVDRWLNAVRAPTWTRQVRLLFVVMSAFDTRWRRRLESLLHRLILPLWGNQRVGPAICAHPSWAPVDVHGLPLTNAMLVPLDPDNGAPSDVPWEMLTRAELGVEAPSVQIKDDTTGGIVFDLNGNQVVRTGRMVAVDRLGMVRFLDGE
jgi:hypothetical protein